MAYHANRGLESHFWLREKSKGIESTQALSCFRSSFARDYGLEIVRLTMAAYLSAERGATVDLTDRATCEELERYVPAIQQGRGAELLRATQSPER